MTVASTITIAYGTAHLISRKLEIGENVICVVEERIPTVMLIPPEDSYNAVKVLWWQARKPLFLGICMSHGKTLPSSALQIRSAKNRESERRLALTSLSDIGNPRYLCNFLAWLLPHTVPKVHSFAENVLVYFWVKNWILAMKNKTKNHFTGCLNLYRLGWAEFYRYQKFKLSFVKITFWTEIGSLTYFAPP